MTKALVVTEIQEVNKIIENDLDDTIKFLNHCAGLGYQTEQEKYDIYVKIASGQGISVRELQDRIEKSRTKLIEVFTILLESNDKELTLEKVTESLNIIAEITVESWEFYSENTRDFLRTVATEAQKFLATTEIEGFVKSEKTLEHRKAVQRFYNSVFGSVEWKNCETELGRKLIKMREKIILSGEPLMNQHEFDNYIEEIKQ